MKKKPISKIIITLGIILVILIGTRFTYGETAENIESLITTTTTESEFIDILKTNGYDYILKRNQIDGPAKYIAILDNFTTEQDLTIRNSKSGLKGQATGWYMEDIYSSPQGYDENKLYLMNNKDMANSKVVIVSGEQQYLNDRYITSNDSSLRYVSWGLYETIDSTRGIAIYLDPLDHNTYYETNNSDIKTYLEESFYIYNENINYTGTYPTIIEKPTQTEINNFYESYVDERYYDMYEIVSHRPPDNGVGTGPDYIRYEYFRVVDGVMPYASPKLYSNYNAYGGNGNIHYLTHTGYMSTDVDGFRYYHNRGDELISLTKYGPESQDMRPDEKSVILNSDNISITEVPDSEETIRIRFHSIFYAYEAFNVDVETNYQYSEETSLAVNEQIGTDFPYTKVERVYDIDLSTNSTGYFTLIHGENISTLKITLDGQISFFDEEELENLLDPDNTMANPSFDASAPNTILGWIGYIGDLIVDTMKTLSDAIKSIAMELQSVTVLIGLMFESMPKSITSLIILALIISIIKMARG